MGRKPLGCGEHFWSRVPLLCHKILPSSLLKSWASYVVQLVIGQTVVVPGVNRKRQRDKRNGTRNRRGGEEKLRLQREESHCIPSSYPYCKTCSTFSKSS